MTIKHLEISADNDHNFKVVRDNNAAWFRFDLSFEKTNTGGKGKTHDLSICWNGVGGIQIVGQLQDGIYIVPEFKIHLLREVMEEHKEEIKKVVKNYRDMIERVHKIGYYGVPIK
jgi:hypothetical protein